MLVGGSSVVLFVGNPWAKLIMGAGLLSVIVWLLRIPTSQTQASKPSNVGFSER